MNSQKSEFIRRKKKLINIKSTIRGITELSVVDNWHVISDRRVMKLSCIELDRISREKRKHMVEMIIAEGTNGVSTYGILLGSPWMDDRTV